MSSPEVPLAAPNRAGRVTIVDVARASGFSVATVSRALRGFANVAPGTVAVVKDVAERLGYRPNPVAAQLRSGATQAVTIVVPTIDSWYYAEVLASAQMVLDEEGYRTFVMVAGDDEGIDRALDTMGPLGRADGLIVVDLPIEPATVDELGRLGITMASAGSVSHGVPTTRVDDRRVGYEATRHLLDLGHRRIGVVRWASRHPGVGGPDLRLAGYHQALREAGLAADPTLDLVVEPNLDGALAAAAVLAAHQQLPSAVFCLSDILAMGVTHTFGELGFDLPAELSIVGVDDRPTAALLGLTTVALPVREIGATAARLLLDRLHDPGPGEEVVLPTGLVVRRSTAPPRVG